MSEQIQGWKDEYLSLVEKLSLVVSVCKELVQEGASGGADLKLKEAHDYVTRLKEVKKNFSLELRLVKDRKLKKEFEAEASLLDGRVSTLVKELRGVQELQSRSSLLSGAAASSSSGLGAKDTKGKSNDDLLSGASQIQDLTMASVNRTAAMIAESQELGESTIENLNDQAAQIADIDAEISVIDSNLKRAEKLITSFTRRMATDKIIQGFAALNIVVLTVLIAYVLITGKTLGGGDGKDAGTVGPSTTTMPTPMPTFAPTV